MTQRDQDSVKTNGIGGPWSALVLAVHYYPRLLPPIFNLLASHFSFSALSMRHITLKHLHLQVSKSVDAGG